MNELREYAKKLAGGDLSAEPPVDNELASGLKSLQATLRHITWQAQRVAEGDYNQRIEFMGDFADAFNTMIEQLKERSDIIGREMDVMKEESLDLQRSNNLLTVITERMSEWIVMIDRRTGERLFSNHIVRDNLHSEIFEEQLYNILFEYAQTMDEDEDMMSEEFPLISDFAMQWFSAILYPVKWEDHEAAACVLTDITDRKLAYEKIENAAYRDPLTGMYNRNFGMEKLESWTNERKDFSLVFIDMDKLKYVNDVFGHAEGDKYINATAELLTASLDPNSYICRLGGDEFMMLVAGTTAESMSDKLEKLRAEFSESTHKSGDGTEYTRSFSFGVVDTKGGLRMEPSSMLSLADERMYEYKKAHKKERRDSM